MPDNTVRLVDIDTLRSFASSLEKRVVKQTVTVAGKPLSSDIELEKVTLSDNFSASSHEGGSYDGSSSLAIYSPNQDVNSGADVTFGTVTAHTLVATLSGEADRARNLSQGEPGSLPYQTRTSNTGFLAMPQSRFYSLAPSSTLDSPVWIEDVTLQEVDDIFDQAVSAV